MFVVNADKSIGITRGDQCQFPVSAIIDGEAYRFQPGDVARLKVFRKKDCETIVLQRDFKVEEETDAVLISLSGDDTKIGKVISKPVDYWYEVELNPDTNPQTIVGYDDDGAKVFKLFPEGGDVDPEDIEVIGPKSLQELVDYTLEQAQESGAFKGDQGDKGDKGDKGDTGDVTPEAIAAVARAEDAAGDAAGSATMAIDVVKQLDGLVATGHIDDAFGASSDYVINSQIIRAVNELESNKQKRLLISTKSVENGETSLPKGAWVMDVTRHLESADIHGVMGSYEAFRKYTIPLIKNPSFEDVEIPGWHTNAPEHTYLSCSNAAKSRYAMLINHTGVHVHSNYAEAIPGQTYNAGCTVVGTNAGDVLQVVLRFFDKDYNMIHSSHTNIVIRGNGVPDSGSVQAIAPEEAVYCYVLLASAASTGRFYCQAGELYCRDELLNTNTRFNDAPIKGWNWDFTQDGHFALSDEFAKERSGRYSLKIEDDSTGQNFVAKSDRIAVSGVSSCGASCYARGSGTAQLAVYFFDSYGNIINGTQIGTFGKVSETEWKKFSVTGPVPKGAAKCEVWLISAVASTGTIYFDNVDFAKNPEAGWTGIDAAYDRFSEWTILDSRISNHRMFGNSYGLDSEKDIFYSRKYYYVDNVAGSDSNAGDSWNTPFATLQKALDTANADGNHDTRIALAQSDAAYIFPYATCAINGLHIVGYTCNRNAEDNSIIGKPEAFSQPCNNDTHPPVTIHFSNNKRAVAFYCGHVNFRGIKFTKETVTLAGQQTKIYADGGMIYFNCCELDTYYQQNGGTLYVIGSHILYLRCESAIVKFLDQPSTFKDSIQGDVKSEHYRLYVRGGMCSVEAGAGVIFEGEKRGAMCFVHARFSCSATAELSLTPTTNENAYDLTSDNSLIWLSPRHWGLVQKKLLADTLWINDNASIANGVITPMGADGT